MVPNRATHLTFMKNSNEATLWRTVHVLIPTKKFYAKSNTKYNFRIKVYWRNLKSTNIWNCIEKYVPCVPHWNITILSHSKPDVPFVYPLKTSGRYRNGILACYVLKVTCIKNIRSFCNTSNEFFKNLFIFLGWASVGVAKRVVLVYRLT